MRSFSDKDLWFTFRKGNKNAISAIYSKYFPELYRYGLKFTSNTYFIEDSIQDLFVELMKNHKTIGDTDNILFYLLKSFRRQLFRRLEKEKRYDLTNEITEDHTFSVIWSVEQAFIQNEEKEFQTTMLTKVMHDLTARQKEAVYLRFTKELDYREIAEIMNISIEACRNLITKAVAKLREAITRKD